MPARPLTIAGIDFAKKGDATEFFKGLLRSKAYGERFEGSEHVALTGLFMRHPEAAEKMQCGIDFFFVDKSPGFSTPCFWIQRKDGSTVDFSIRHCLDQKGKTPSRFFRVLAARLSSEILPSPSPILNAEITEYLNARRLKRNLPEKMFMLTIRTLLLTSLSGALFALKMLIW